MKHLVSFLAGIGLLASSAHSQQMAQLSGGAAHAFTADAALARSNKGDMSIAAAGFEENKGQVRTTDGDAAPFVRYRLSQGNTHLFLLENGIAYQFSRVHYPEGYAELMAGHDVEKQKQLDTLREQVRLETFRMNMLLEGANPAASITTEGRSTDYTQYYNHDALDVHTYTKVTYHEVYPGIDWVVYTTEKGMKYDFVLLPGADPDQIRLRFEHHEELAVDADGNLIHGNRMGRFTEERPVSFQDGKKVPTSFVLEGNTLRFTLGNYDRNRTLIIDPARIWGTYYGGGLADDAHGCATDQSGNVFITGSTNSVSAIAAAGHQNTVGGQVDAFLVKFTSDGQRLWGTYCGGTSGDHGQACTVDGSGNVFVAGITNSTTGIASGGHQNTTGSPGLDTPFLVKFNSAGVRQWGTYYGGAGAGAGQGRDCATDGNGNVYLAGQTQSGPDIAAGGHQVAFGGGADDSFLVQFNSAGVRQWATYYGGSGSEAPQQGCVVDGNNNVYLSGYTSSMSGISAGGHQNAFAGGFSDCFLVKFNSAGVRQWGTYYGGPASDSGGACAVDGSGNIFLSGATNSPTDIAAGGHQNTLGGGIADGFLVKFNSAGQRLWGSYYGGALQEDGWACAADADGNAYLVGTTYSPSGIADGGHQNTLAGDYNAYLASFNADGTRQWATYYGQELFTSGLSCGIASTGDVYLAGFTSSTSGIAEGGHQNAYGGGNTDAYLVKFACDEDADADGIVDCADDCPNTPGVIGSACDDGDENTNGDMINAECECVGTLECTVADLQETEPNNSNGTATPLPYATPISGSLGACTPTDNTADYFSIVTTGQGALRVEACLSNTGPDPLDVTFQVILQGFGVLGSFTLVSGANGQAITSSFELPCRGMGTYYIWIANPSTTVCTHYAFSYSTLAPAFGNDPEPNDGGFQAAPVDYDSFQEGQIAFTGDNADYFVITPTLQGVMRIEVEAENGSDSPGTMDVTLAYSGVPIIVETIPVGANGQPITTTVSIPCRGASSSLLVFFDDASACGTSYRWRYYTTDPYFVNDAEPNNSVAASILLPEDTNAFGQLNFHLGVDGGGADNTDVYRTDLPTDGVLNVTIEAEHAGPSDAETIQVQVRNSGGVTLTTWNGAIGANSNPALSTFSLPCRGATIPYYLWLSAGACGTSYRVSWNGTPALFANDAEPNNTAATAIPMDLSTSWYDGHIGFYNTTDDDLYVFSHPGGAWSAVVSAEHAGTDEGTLTMQVRTLSGVVVSTFPVPAGGASTALTNTFTIPTLNAASYRIFMSDVTCGVSYRIHCATDADNDGICDVADLCPGGPEPGTPCDDGNAVTVDDVITVDCLCEGDITTGISGTDATNGDLRIWPNPATNEVWIEIGDGSTEPATLNVRDLLGRTVMVLGPIAANAPGQYMVQLGGMAQGTYIIELRVGGRQWSRRIVKT